MDSVGLMQCNPRQVHAITHVARKNFAADGGESSVVTLEGAAVAEQPRNNAAPRAISHLRIEIARFRGRTERCSMGQCDEELLLLFV